MALDPERAQYNGPACSTRASQRNFYRPSSVSIREGITCKVAPWRCDGLEPTNPCAIHQTAVPFLFLRVMEREKRQRRAPPETPAAAEAKKRGIVGFCRMDDGIVGRLREAGSAVAMFYYLIPLSHRGSVRLMTNKKLNKKSNQDTVSLFGHKHREELGDSQSKGDLSSFTKTLCAPVTVHDTNKVHCQQA
jgi:hypothetical protein